MIFLKFIKSFILELILFFFLTNVVYTNKTNIKETENKKNINQIKIPEKTILRTEKKNNNIIKDEDIINVYELEQLKVVSKENKRSLDKKKKEHEIRNKPDKKNENDIYSKAHYPPENLSEDGSFINYLNMDNQNSEIDRNIKEERNFKNNRVIEKFFISLVNNEKNDYVIRGEDDDNNSSEIKSTNENQDKDEDVSFTESLIKNMMHTRENVEEKTVKGILENPEDLNIITHVANENFQRGKELFDINRDHSETIKYNILKRSNDINDTTSIIDEGVYKLEQIIMKVRFYTTAIMNFINFKSNYICEYYKCGENARCYITEKNKEQCRCRASYIQDFSVNHFRCIPMDDKNCSVNNGFCDRNANCSITNDKIKCQCKYGFFGDGIFCVKNNQIKNSLCIFIIFLIYIFQKYFL